MQANLTGGPVATFDVIPARDGTLFDDKGRHVEFAFIVDAQEYITCPCGICEYERLAEEAYEAERTERMMAHESYLDSLDYC